MDIAVPLWDRFEYDYPEFLSRIEPAVRNHAGDDQESFDKIMAAIKEECYDRTVASPPEWEEEGVEALFKNPKDGARLAERGFHKKNGWMAKVPEKAEELRLPLEKLKKLLGFDDEEVLDDIQENALRILDVCNNPSNQGADWGVNRKGLVFGMVQSGKTANMLSLISLAMRSGYRLFILLSGDKEALRTQTQNRVNSAFDLVNGMNRKLDTYPCRIHSPTFNTDLIKIFGGNYASNLRYMDRVPRREDWCTIIVTKKETNNLEALANQIREFEKEMAVVDPSMDMGELFPTLIIDDEGDYASLNKGPKDKPSKIFSNIVDIRNTIPHNCFAAYTATPQRVVLAADDPVGYPRDFWWMIEPFYTLDPQTGERIYKSYLGIWEVFRRYDRYLINKMSNEEWPHHEKVVSGKSEGIRIPAGPGGEPPSILRPAKELLDIESEFLDDILDGKRDPMLSLRNAIIDYLITCGVRWWRNWNSTQKSGKPTTDLIENEGDYDYHSMMIHLSLKRENHKKIRAMVEALWDGVKSDFESFDPSSSPDDHPFGNRWRYQTERTHYLIAGHPKLPYKDIRYFIEKCVEITERPVLDPVPSPATTYPGEPWVYLVNSMPEEGMKLNYSKDLPPKLRTKKAAIIVGGNILSRGLTLEGLCVSLYSRSASDEKHDTDLQRARWLGHKRSLIDVTSVFMQGTQIDVFRDIALNDLQLRKQLKIALHNFHTPTQAMLQLRNTPLTSPSSTPQKKKSKGMGFTGKRVVLDTPSLDLDDMVENERILGKFKGKHTSYEKDHKIDIARDYDFDDTIKLLRRFKCRKSAPQISFKELADYLERWKQLHLTSGYPPPPSVNIAIRQPGERQRKLNNSDYPKSESDALENARPTFSTIPRGPTQNGPFMGDAFLDKSMDWHRDNQGASKTRSSKGDLLIVIYPLDPNYVRRSYYDWDNRSNEKTNGPTVSVKGGIRYTSKDRDKFTPGDVQVLTYAAWVPKGGPVSDVWSNKWLSWDDLKQIGMHVLSEDEEKET